MVVHSASGKLGTVTAAAAEQDLGAAVDRYDLFELESRAISDPIHLGQDVVVERLDQARKPGGAPQHRRPVETRAFGEGSLVSRNAAGDALACLLSMLATSLVGGAMNLDDGKVPVIAVPRSRDPLWCRRNRVGWNVDRCMDDKAGQAIGEALKANVCSVR